MLDTLLIFIFIRPFICSLAFPFANFIYTSLLLFFMLVWIIKRGISFKDKAALKLPLILFSLSLVLSILFSINKRVSLPESYKYACGIYLLLIISSLSLEEKAHIRRILVFTGFIIGILAIYQYFFGFRHTLGYLRKYGLLQPFTLDYLQSKRIFFPFVTPNILGGYLGIILPLTLINPNRYTLLFIFPFVQALVLTKSISALLSFLLGFMLYLYLQKELNKRKIISSSISFIAFFTALLFLFFLRTTTPKQHLQPLFSLFMRLNYWKHTFKVILDYPLTGRGIGNFNLMQSRYAHNSYLQLWAETGIVGIISFIWLVVAIIKSGLKSNNLYKNIFLTSIAIFLIHNLFDFSFFLPEVSIIWWVILGLFL
ncbi:MAG: O-antigen ligase family protein [Candidatus Omnitrophica bacterium]|nr:O-antigen ligase family protein [Candidatus Omnitrophota bacterium]